MRDEFDDELLEIFSVTDIRRSGAYQWDSLIEELPAWRNLKYRWIASSCFGDQIIVTDNSPIHIGTALYMHGPDVAGANSEDPNWIDNILYLGPSVKDWLARVEKFGSEYSICPGSLDENLGTAAEEYRAIYRKLNPGLAW